MTTSALGLLAVPGMVAAAPLSGLAAWLDDFYHTILGRLATMAFIVVCAFLVSWLLRVIIRQVVNRIVGGVKKGQGVDDTRALVASPLAAVRVVQRTRTLGSVLSNVVNVVVAIITIILLVRAINPDIVTSFALLTAALGAGLGFGAQNIVKDLLNGLFMVMEDQLGVGDVVDVGSATGVVEVVGIRITQVRDVNGTLWFVRNGEITRVGNMSLGWARVIVDLAVPYDTDIDAVQESMKQVAVGLTTDRLWRSHILDQPEVWGIQSISGDAIVLRLVLKTRTTSKDDVSRELRQRLKTAIDELGVTLPSLSAVVLSGFDSAGSVTGANPPRTHPVPTVDKRKKPRRQRGSKPRDGLHPDGQETNHGHGNSDGHGTETDQ